MGNLRNVHAELWPHVVTDQAGAMTTVWMLFLVVALGVAVIVLGLIAFSLVRWRRRAGDGQPPQFRNNYPLEIAWTAIPLLIVTGLFYDTYRAEARVDRLDARPAVIVDVNAYRWGWTFAYRGGPTVGGAASAPAIFGRASVPPELVLPIGETTRIELSASDVDHGFWIPAFLFKRDAIPGQTTAFDLLPNRLGSFGGRCSAFCGLEHANMLFRVRVVTRADFARWRVART